jgi:hypothetical protein
VQKRARESICNEKVEVLQKAQSCHLITKKISVCHVNCLDRNLCRV